MSHIVLEALAGYQILERNSLGTVTDQCVLWKKEDGREVAVSLDCISTVRRVHITYPGLLVISTGVFVIAAAAASSHQGGGAALPAALLGLAFVVAYLVSRRAFVEIRVDSETLQTPAGSLRHAGALVAALHLARKDALQAAA